MNTREEIHDRIQFFRKYTLDMPLSAEILEALNDKLATLESRVIEHEKSIEGLVGRSASLDKVVKDLSDIHP